MIFTEPQEESLQYGLARIAAPPHKGQVMSHLSLQYTFCAQTEAIPVSAKSDTFHDKKVI